MSDLGKDMRRALLTARRPALAGGGALEQAIKNFSKARAAQWDPQGTALAMSRWDPQGVAMQQANRLMLAEDPPLPPSKPRSLLGDLEGDAQQGNDLGKTVEDGWKAFGPKPAALNGAGAAPSTGHVNLAGSQQTGDTLEGLLANIAKIESGGWKDPYIARGPWTHGDRAYGKYQVMGNNIPSWTKEVLGQSMTPEQFLANPDAQEAVARAKIGGYLQQYGNPQDAASLWFTGRPLAQGKNMRDVVGTSGADYAARATQGLSGGNPAPVEAAGPAAPTGPAPKPLVQSWQNTPAVQQGAPPARIHVSDPTNPDFEYPGPNETTSSTPKPMPSRPISPTPRFDAPQNPDAGMTLGSLGPADDQSHDKAPPPTDTSFLDDQMTDPTLTAKRGGSIKRALKVARKARAYGGITGAGPDGGLALYQQMGMSPDQTLAMLYGNAAFSAPEPAMYTGANPNSGGWGSVYNGVDTSQHDALQALSNYYAGNPSSKSAAPTTPAPAAPPPIQNNTVGNSYQVNGTQGAPLGPGQHWENTLNEVLGTNNPSMNDIFGFDYPNIPPPQPLPYSAPQSTSVSSLSWASPSSSYPGSMGFDTYNGSNNGPSPNLVSPAALTFPGTNDIYLPPLIGGGNTNNSPPGSVGQIPHATPQPVSQGHARGGAISAAMRVARVARDRRSGSKGSR